MKTICVSYPFTINGLDGLPVHTNVVRVEVSDGRYALYQDLFQCQLAFADDPWDLIACSVEYLSYSIDLGPKREAFGK